MKHLLAITISFVACQLALAQEPMSIDWGSMAREALAVSRPCLVRIETTARDGRRSTSQTGIKVGNPGEILTSLSGLEQNPAAIIVETQQGLRQPATIVGRDYRRSIVLLRLPTSANDSKNEPIPKILPARDIRVGQWVYAVGNTWLDAPALSLGIVSALDRVWGRAIQIDAKVSPVNYGGPLIDHAGNLLAIITPLDPLGRTLSSSAAIYDSGVGFAVPLEPILADLPRLRQGDIHAGQTGITFLGTDELLDAPTIGQIAWRSPAEKAGILPGDLIVKIDQRPIARRGEFFHALGNATEGQTISLSFQRGLKTTDTNIELVSALPTYRWPTLGILAQATPQGTEIIGVIPQSPAERAGIRPKQIIMAVANQALTKQTTLRSILDQKAIGENLSLELKSPAGNKRIELPVEEGMKAILAPDLLPTRGDTSLPSSVLRQQAAGIDYWIRLPRRQPNEAVGLLLAFEGYPAPRRSTILSTWEKASDRSALAIAGIEPLRAGRWSIEDIDRSSRLIDALLQTLPIDPHRVIIHGSLSSAGFAAQLAMTKRDHIRGLIILGRLLPATAPMHPSSKLALVQFDLANTSAGRAPQAETPSINAASIATWTNLGYPVVELPPITGNYLSPEQADQLGRWSWQLSLLH
jgi:serine protease Do